MDRMPWQAVVFQSFPEGIVVICLGLALVGFRPPWLRVIMGSALYAAVSYLIRGLPLPYGIHTLLHIPVLMLLISVVVGVRWKGGTMAAMTGLFGLLVVESLVLPAVFAITDLSPAQVIADRWLRVLVGVPQETILGILAYLCWRFGWYFVKAKDLEQIGREDDR